MYDNICKFIAEKFATDLATWLLGKSVPLTRLEPTELQVDPIRADRLIFLQSHDLILHIEFQTDPNDDIPFRMADYRLRIHRRFPNKSVHQVVIYLRSTCSPLVQVTTFDLPPLHHAFNVIRLWEVPTAQLMTAPGLLPFAILSQTTDRVAVLQEIAQQIEDINDPTEQSDVLATTAVLAGLVLDKMTIRRILKGEIMKESVIYQDILEEGIREGIREGKIEGIQEGESKVLLRILQRRLGTIPPSLSDRIQQLSVEQLEDLSESLLDFNNLVDLTCWIDR